MSNPTMPEMIVELLKADLAEKQGRLEVMEDIIRDFIDNTCVPEKDCSCHIASPCQDCVENSGTRELIERAKAICEGGAR